MHKDITALILAGGKGSRMQGKDKGLMTRADGSTLIAGLIDSLQDQVSHIVINANRHQATYQEYGYPVVEDGEYAFCGPLAGMLAGLKVVRTRWLFVVPCDTFFLPPLVLDRLLLGEGSIRFATKDDRRHPLFALIASDLCHALEEFLPQGIYKVEKWYATQNAITISFDGEDAALFANINTPEDKKSWLTP